MVWIRQRSDGCLERPLRIPAISIVLLLIAISCLSMGAGEQAPIPSYPYLVVVDPGHGGRDPGAIGVGGVKEKDITFAIAEMVYIKSLSQSRFRVILTRRDDRFISTTDRILWANEIQGDIYVSIHANAFSDAYVSGVETLMDETQKGDQESYLLGELLQEQLVTQTGGVDRGLKWRSLYIGRAKMPAVLVETGFLTNPCEAQLLQNISYQSKIADAIILSINCFLDSQ
jgi:N-acetylmuramoyl-L-alanine amidase